tara:strand:- start:294 stop:1001 length:708 start_codon:yes stop_codon:yes gene_type:complete
MRKSHSHRKLANSTNNVAAFLDKLSAIPVVKPITQRGRLIFALDATASRQPTWDRACGIQGEMFNETAGLGGIEMQMVFYRGFGDFQITPWYTRSDALVEKMTAVQCLGGHTQMEKVLNHAICETRNCNVDAVVFVGDCLEEDIDSVCRVAGELGVLGVPMFLFQEGVEPTAQMAFRQIARLTKGAYCQFDLSSAQQLCDLLRAVAVYAAGGRRALADFGARTGKDALLIAQQIK